MFPGRRQKITIMVRNLDIVFALWKITFNLGIGDTYLCLQYKAVQN